MGERGVDRRTAVPRSAPVPPEHHDSLVVDGQVLDGIDVHLVQRGNATPYATDHVHGTFMRAADAVRHTRADRADEIVCQHIE